MTDSSEKNKENDRRLLEALTHNRQQAFILIFRKYYVDMIVFAGTFIPEKNVCEDIVQNVFMKMWENRHDLNLHTSIKSYLIKSVRNQCIDEVRHRKIEHRYASDFDGKLWDRDTEDYILYSDLNRHLYMAMAKLPKEERAALIMSRRDGLKYTEIAARCNVSVRTIENRVSKALARLRELLKNHR